MAVRNKRDSTRLADFRRSRHDRFNQSGAQIPSPNPANASAAQCHQGASATAAITHAEPNLRHRLPEFLSKPFIAPIHSVKQADHRRALRHQAATRPATILATWV